jgi:hypothetical protein
VGLVVDKLGESCEAPPWVPSSSTEAQLQWAANGGGIRGAGTFSFRPSFGSGAD